MSPDAGMCRAPDVVLVRVNSAAESLNATAALVDEASEAVTAAVTGTVDSTALDGLALLAEGQHCLCSSLSLPVSVEEAVRAYRANLVGVRAGRSADVSERARRYDNSLANGQGIVYRDDRTSMGDDPETHRVRDNVRNEGQHDVVVHGAADGWPIPGHGHNTNPEQIVESIMRNPFRDPGRPSG